MAAPKIKISFSYPAEQLPDVARFDIYSCDTTNLTRLGPAIASVTAPPPTTSPLTLPGSGYGLFLFEVVPVGVDGKEGFMDYLTVNNLLPKVGDLKKV